ncbi:MAG TPA: AAA family ATPase [Haliangium sp.]|nr:AAA family ATPase [Haliangium sp.]
MRFFNTAGPCAEAWHYMLPAADRLPDVPRLVERGMYFGVHAPHQTGKSTTMKALARQLTERGQLAALRISCETASVAGDDHVLGQRDILQTIRDTARSALPAELWPPAEWPAADDTHLLSAGLRAWVHACPRPVVLFLDEFDALQGKTLRSVLLQLRAEAGHRPEHALWSLGLCGLRDVHDVHVAGSAHGALDSFVPFNIQGESLRLGDFSESEVAALYAQHTAETGQPFTDEALARAFALTRGQPWLVNALAHEITHEMRIEPPTPITAEHVDQARERLIRQRPTHLDWLLAQLRDDRVRRVIEPLLTGVLTAGLRHGDAEYVHDLGLVARGPTLHIANPIYGDAIVRYLGAVVENGVALPPGHFVGADGRLELPAVLRAFAALWQEHGAEIAPAVIYADAAPQIALVTYLHRILNGTGFVDCEYGIERGHIQVQLRWPYQDQQGQRQWHREVIEIRVWRPRAPDPLDEGLQQLDESLARLGLDHGVLMIADRHAARSSDEPARPMTFKQARTPKGRVVTVLRV